MTNFLDVEGLDRIFEVNGFSVYLDHKPTFDIIVESGDDMTRYRLYEDKGIFLIRVDEQIRTDPAMGRHYSLTTHDSEVASRDDKKVALEYFFQKILEKWGSRATGPELEAVLRTARW